MKKYFSDDLKDLIVTLSKYIIKSPCGLEEVLSEVRDESIRQAMKECGGVKAKAARMLNMPRTTVLFYVQKDLKEKLEDQLG